MATIKDVAREARVSTATVSRVMTGRNPVSDGMREQVLGAADRLHYRPNALAKSLRIETTGTLGLVVSNVMNPFFTAVARAVEDAAADRGYSVIIGNADEDPEKEERYVDALLQKQVDGFIVSPARGESLLLGEVAASGTPLVFVDRSIDGLDVPVVRADGRRAIAQLVEHLVYLGHTRLAIISGPESVVSGRERLQAFVEAAKEMSVKVVREYTIVGSFRRESGEIAMRKLLALPTPPTAVLAANNLMALGALQSIKASGLSIPGDISVASFDDVRWFELLDPPLTAIAQPTREIGAKAARMLLQMVEGRERPESYITEAELMIRGSCAAPRGVERASGGGT